MPYIAGLAPPSAAALSRAPQRIPVPAAERDFVDQAISDPKFGAKNYYILDRFWGYNLDKPSPAWPTWTPPPPDEDAPPDPKLLPRARTFETITASAASSSPPRSLHVDGVSHDLTLIGATPQEQARIEQAISHLDDSHRASLDGVKTIYVGDFDVYKSPSGSVSDKTSPVKDLKAGSILFNRGMLEGKTRALPADATAASRQAAQAADSEAWKSEIASQFTQFDNLAHSLSYDQAVEEAKQNGPVTQMHFDGLPGTFKVVGAHPEELEYLKHAVDAIPPNDRGFLQNLKTLYVADVPVYRTHDGDLSTATTGVSDTDGTMVLNRQQLNYFRNHLPTDAPAASRVEASAKDEHDWVNCVDHEMAHFEDNASDSPPSRAKDSPMGHGVWYTNYSWRTQDQAEDLAEGFAILAQKRWDVYHQITRPTPQHA